jgi:DNA-binding winged helix-turn-helix (wHTH) protein
VIFEFGDFELDERMFELRRSGRHVGVQPKALRLILYLVENRSRAVSTKELFQVLWPAQTVGHTSLTKAVRRARVALDDNGSSPAAVRTVRGRGYRFALAVRQHADGTSGLPAPGEGAPQGAGAPLSSLSSDCRAVLVAAAVLGFEFSFGNLRAVAPTSDDRLMSLLVEATERGLLRPCPDANGRYAFSRWDLRDTLCELLPARELQGIHQRIGTVLERSVDGEH